MAKFSERLRPLEGEMVETLKELCSHETPTGAKKALDRLGRDLAKRFSAYGQAELLPTEGAGDHLKITVPGRGEGQVLVLAHRDTVFATGTLERNRPRVEGERLYGPGAIDCKGGIVTFLYALRALAEAGVAPARTVVGLITTDEETGSATSRSVIEAEAQRSVACLVLEPALGPGGKLKTFRKGVGAFTLKIHGKAAHAGADPTAGVNAVQELALQVQYLHSLTDLTVGTTVNVGVVQGGSKANVIPDYAEAQIDVRFSTRAEGERVAELILGLEPQIEGAKLEVSGGIDRYPLERTPEAVRLFELARRLGQDELGVALGEGGTGGASDGNLAAGVGCPTLDGLGVIGEGMHTYDEHVVISSLPERAALLARLLAEI